MYSWTLQLVPTLKDKRYLEGSVKTWLIYRLKSYVAHLCVGHTSSMTEADLALAQSIWWFRDHPGYMAPKHKKKAKKFASPDPELQQILRILGCERICAACWMSYWHEYLEESLVITGHLNLTWRCHRNRSIYTFHLPHLLRRDIQQLEAVSKDCDCDAISVKLMAKLEEEGEHSQLS